MCLGTLVFPPPQFGCQVDTVRARRAAEVVGFRTLRHAARFFNNEMWFDEEEVGIDGGRIALDSITCVVSR